MGRVLILDGMWNKSLAAVRSFGRRGFHVAAGEKTRLATALFSRYCKRRIVYPSATAKKAAFLSFLEDELKTNRYDVLLPMEFSTQVLLTSPAIRERLEQYTRIPFADADLAVKVNDKAFLMRYALEKGFDVPDTSFPDDKEGIEEIADRIKYPAVIKPRVSSGSRGIMYVKTRQELPALYAAVHEKYPFPLIQEYIPDGGTFGAGLLLNSRSEIRAIFVYKRLRSYPVAGGPSTLRESVSRDDIGAVAGSLMKSLKWTGIAHVEFRTDPRDGKVKLLEVNPRFWGSLQLAVESEMDFPFLLYRMAMEGDIEQAKEYKAGVRCRWLIPGDLLHFLKNPGRFGLKPGFFDFSAKDDIISVKDPMPTIGRVLSGLALVYDKELRKTLNR